MEPLLADLAFSALYAAINGAVEGTVAHLLQGKQLRSFLTEATPEYAKLAALIRSKKLRRARSEFDRLLTNNKAFERKVTELFSQQTNQSNANGGPSISGDRNSIISGQATQTTANRGGIAAQSGSTIRTTTGVSGRVLIAIVVPFAVVILGVAAAAVVIVLSLRPEIGAQAGAIETLNAQARAQQSDIAHLAQQQADSDEAIRNLQSPEPSDGNTADSTPNSITPTGTTAPTGPIYLADLPNSYFIRGGGSCLDDAAVAMNRQDFPHSVTYGGSYCDKSTNVEFNIPEGYSHFKASIGWSDASPSTASGRFEISCANGNPPILAMSTEVTYPDIKAVDLDTSQCQRVNISISNIESREIFVLGDAQLS
ncbi:MAG: hypothetical protein LBV00_06900 [Propionibacteriaceae bacterium]|nr:hypothetical protein [Propionibacteriaceae bacterium]